MSATELRSLFDKHGSDKGRTNHYEHIYEWLFSDLRNKPDLRILEIGVLRGASLRAWEDYFPQAEIVGIDLKPECANLVFDRARVVIGHSAHRETYNGLGDFDIVIDDASHISFGQITAMQIMLPRTRHLYVIEDIWPSARYGLRTLEETFARIQSEARLWRNNEPKTAWWTVFARQLVAFKRSLQFPFSP